jgi:hypothetical protein
VLLLLLLLLLQLLLLLLLLLLHALVRVATNTGPASFHTPGGMRTHI